MAVLQFVNETAPGNGTPLDAAHLNSLAVGDSAMIVGSVPTSGSGLDIAMPAATYIVNGGNYGGAAAVAVSVTSQTVSITGSANQTKYIYVSDTGVYSQGTSASPPDAQHYIVVAKAVINGAANGLTSVSQMASPYALHPGVIGPDLAEGYTINPLNGTALQRNLERIRGGIVNTLGVANWAAVMGSPPYAYALNGDVTFKGALLSVHGSASATAGAQAGLAAALSMGAGSDRNRGYVNFTAGSGVSIGEIAIVTFDADLPTVAYLFVSQYGAGNPLLPRIERVATNSLRIYAGIAPSASTVYQFMYLVLG